MVMTKPLLGRGQLFDKMQRVGKQIFQEGGVITNIMYNGPQPLAYPVRQPGLKFTTAHIYQFQFSAKSTSIDSLRHELAVDDDILRHVFVKQPKHEDSIKVLRKRSKKEAKARMYQKPEDGHVSE